MHSSEHVSDPRGTANDDIPVMPVVRLFDLDIAAVSFDEAVEGLAQAAVRRDGRARIVVTPNVDHVVRLDASPEFRERYAKADFIFADGMPVVWASRFLGQPLPERITGSEPDLLARFAQYYPGLNIDIVSPSMRFDPLGPEGQAYADRVRERQPDVVFLCVGMPKQEHWVLHHAGELPGGILLCVGAAMEFAIGLQRRAPMWMQRIGLEWLWRLASNPRRLWRRYLVDDPRFLGLCWRQWRKRRGSAP